MFLQSKAVDGLDALLFIILSLHISRGHCTTIRDQTAAEGDRRNRIQRVVCPVLLIGASFFETRKDYYNYDSWVPTRRVETFEPSDIFRPPCGGKMAAKPGS